jgi:hypothetical protein
MKTRLTRLGRRSPGRILAVPRPDTGDWPPAGASQWRPDGKGPQMADIIEVILADHKRIRRLLRALDDAARYGEDPYAGWMLAPMWCRLADLLQLHAEAEEEICYLALFGQGRTRPRRWDAIADHDDFREDLWEASARRRFCDLVARIASALRASSDHVAREERGALAAFGRRAVTQ